MNYELCARCRKLPNDQMCQACQDEVRSRKRAFTPMTVEANSDAFELEEAIYDDGEVA